MSHVIKIDQSILETYHYSQVSESIKVFYTEAGSKDKPVLLLLHGYPTSSRQFHELISFLSPYFHLIAPDLPGFGLTEYAEGTKITFDFLADTIDLLLVNLKVKKFSVFIFDYGAPTGLRLALKRPNDVTAIITQNGNAYEEGLGAFWDPLKTIWSLEDKKDKLSVEEKVTYNKIYEALSQFTSNEGGYSSQYFDGESDISRVNPELHTIDRLLLATHPNYIETQVGLFLDYRHNVELYPRFQEYFRTSNVPILAVWGDSDPHFIAAGAEAFKRDSQNTKVALIRGAGHFASQSHSGEIAQEILTFFKEGNLV